MRNNTGNYLGFSQYQERQRLGPGQEVKTGSKHPTVLTHILKYGDHQDRSVARAS